MGRTTPAKGIHTSPERAGRNSPNIDNLPVDKEQDTMLQDILDGVTENNKKLQAYKGAWTEDKFAEIVDDYFRYSAEKGLKPCKAGLRLWLGCSRAQYYDWETFPNKHGYKTDILARASELIEMTYVGRSEKYPTANIFLLKSSHGHIEQSKLDITTNGSNINSAEDVKDLVAKLGLDKKK